MLLPLHTSRLILDTQQVSREAAGSLDDVVRAHLSGEGPPGLVLLGTFGSGKSSLCQRLAAEPADDHPPCSVVPLALVSRAGQLEEGLRRVLGAHRLAEARGGQRILLLDGLDEVPLDDAHGYEAWFDRLTAAAGPRWVLTSRPSHVRTAFEPDPSQVDTLSRPDVATLFIDPLSLDTVHEVLGDLPNGAALLRSVEGLEELAASPLFLHIVRAALPHIEPGRPIEAWGLFDAWLRHALHTGPLHSAVLVELELLAWRAFREHGYATEVMSFSGEQLAEARIPPVLRRALMVTDLDGQVRFGHRSVFEYLLAAHIAPRLAANQGHGPDELSGLRITDATRAFLVGRVPAMPVRFEGDRVRIPRGNFISGGDRGLDERPLRIEHLAEPFWISRVPVTHADWSGFLAARPDDRQDATYLRHWGPDRVQPEGTDALPIFHIWPEDADAYASWAGARLPTADEWEKAVRGLDGRRWPWGDHWRHGRAITAETGVAQPLPVRAFGAQGVSSLFSAVGGVFEYTASPYRGREDLGRVVMGGCFTHPAPTARPSLRLSHTLSGHLKAGLRLAWDVS